MLTKKLLALLVLLAWTGGAHAQQGEGALLQRDDFQKLLDEGRTLLSNGDTSGACPQFHYVLKNGVNNETYYFLAEVELARCLYEKGLPLSSYLVANRVVDAGAAHPGYVAVIPLLLQLSTLLEGDTSLLERLATYDEKDVPENARDRVNFLAGRFAYVRGDLEIAETRLLRVGTADEELYLRAKFLGAVVYVRQGNAGKALEAFKDILRFREGSGVRTDFAEKIYERTYLNMARLFYSVNDFEMAIKYYAKIEQESEFWVQTLFEASWAYFRLGDYSKAMGNLWTISSPYFEDEFYPEAFLIEANILFERCHYDEALDIVTRFHEQYYKLYTELKTQLKKYEDPNEFYFYLARLSRQGGNMSLELKRIFNAAFVNQNIKRLLGMVVRISDEMKRVEELTKNPLWNDLASETLVEIGSYRDLLVGEAGDQTKTRLREVYSEIKGLLAKGIKLKIETINARKKIPEQGAIGKTVIDPGTVTPPDHQFFPFDGEYWRDELDSYYFVIESVCPSQQP
jgi:tetratricopeptide (TPR) repeat protein